MQAARRTPRSGSSVRRPRATWSAAPRSGRTAGEDLDDPCIELPGEVERARLGCGFICERKVGFADHAIAPREDLDRVKACAERLGHRGGLIADP